MIFQEKHGIPSVLPCYFTSKVGILGKRWDSKKSWVSSKNLEYQQKDDNGHTNNCEVRTVDSSCSLISIGTNARVDVLVLQKGVIDTQKKEESTCFSS